MKHSILLEDGTIGTIEPSSIGYQNPELFIGERLVVLLNDENGMLITKSGKVAEILETGFIA